MPTVTTIVPITLPDLTTACVGGTGVFDVLMKTAREHLEGEFKANRIKGPEYAQVYLGSLTQILQTSIQFLLEKDKAALEAELVAQQVLLAQAQVLKTTAEIALVEVEVLKAEAELLLIQQQLPKITAEIALLTAQTAKTNQDTANAVLEALNIPKQGAVLDNQAQKLVAEAALIDAQALLVVQNKLNAITEGANLIKQGCVLDAQFNLLSGQVLKTAQETLLMAQKVATEKAQTLAAGVDADSVIGKQKSLYAAQTDGFSRNAEQQAAKIMVDTWNVRRTTDEGTLFDGVNKLNDTYVGHAVTKLLTGVGAI